MARRNTNHLAKLRKKGRRYHGIFYDRDRHPKQKWVALGTADEAAARHKLTQLERDYIVGRYDPWKDNVPDEGITLQKAVEQYLQVRERTRRPKTARADRSLLELFIAEQYAGVQLRHIKEHHVESFLDRDDLADSTRVTYYARLNHFFGWAMKEALLRENPMERMERPPKGRTVEPYLSRDQYEQVLRCIQADATLQGDRLKPGEVVWLLDVVKLAVGTGLRLGEICHLRWRAVDLHTGMITVQNTDTFTTKSGHERAVPIAGEALHVLQRLAEERKSERNDYVFVGVGGDKLNEEYVSKRFLHYVRMAKLPDGVHFHTLRHTYASWLVMNGVDLFRVQRLLGHASIETTQRYAHLAPNDFRADVARVFGSSTGSGRVRESHARYAVEVAA